MINKGFRIPDHYTLENAFEHPKFGPVLRLASNVKLTSKYDIKFVDANFTEGNWFFAKMIQPSLGKKVEKLDGI